MSSISRMHEYMTLRKEGWSSEDIKECLLDSHKKETEACINEKVQRAFVDLHESLRKSEQERRRLTDSLEETKDFTDLTNEVNEIKQSLAPLKELEESLSQELETDHQKLLAVHKANESLLGMVGEYERQLNHMNKCHLPPDSRHPIAIGISWNSSNGFNVGAGIGRGCQDKFSNQSSKF